RRSIVPFSCQPSSPRENSTILPETRALAERRSPGFACQTFPTGDPTPTAARFPSQARAVGSSVPPFQTTIPEGHSLTPPPEMNRNRPPLPAAQILCTREGAAMDDASAPVTPADDLSTRAV